MESTDMTGGAQSVPRIEHDWDVGAMYVYLCGGDVAFTLSVSDSTNVDINTAGQVAGVEVIGDDSWCDGLVALVLSGQLTAHRRASDDQSILMTTAEHDAIRAAGVLYTSIARDIIEHGITRDDDLAELRSHIHAIQNMIKAQVAGRVYPGEFRLLGDVITPRESLNQ